MTDERCPEMHLLVQADLDGELTPAEAARLVAHLEACPGCAALSARLATLATSVRAGATRHDAPDALRARIAALAPPSAATRVEPARVPNRLRRAGPFGAAGLAIAAALVLVLLPRGPDLAGQIEAGHIRALQPGHLMDVVSTDQHTVKPWFDGRLDFAPPVRDLKEAGFPLQGGRLDYVAGRPVAVLIYSRRQHVIDLFIWPAKGDEAPDQMQRNGYNMLHWTEGGMVFWAVSDVDVKDLAAFVARFRS